MLTLRVEPETKARIEDAARSRGKSLTDFVLDAATKAAARVEANPTTPGIGRFTGTPTFFRALVMTAQSGGENGYFSCGFELSRNVPDLIPHDQPTGRSWEMHTDRLAELAIACDAEAVLDWFDEHYPLCMECVPNRRRERFAAGVIDFFDQIGW